ncbi:lipase [Prevotella bivia]|uniref:lipase n=1 Tax=Prevotella bivia TaxID=28125 RepID=UPI00065F80DA|nr:lipase [Prevotella bivia]
MKIQTKVLLLMIAALSIIMLYAAIPFEIAVGHFRLKKIQFPTLFYKADPKPIVVKKKKRFIHKHQTILFFGDSMVEGLSRRFGDYCGENGHILYSVIWYSSTTEKWATSNVLEHLIKEYHPTYLILCVGSNELFVNDLDQREEYILQIMKKVGKLPFVWISPNDWNGDTGVVDLMKKHAGEGHFFDSRPLKLHRGSDHYHPTWKSAAYWMDKTAIYLAGRQCAAPLYLQYPKHHHKATKTKIFPPSFEGY